MAIGRSFTSLQLYDVLANLVPGAILLIVIQVNTPLISLSSTNSPVLSAGIVAVLALILGHMIQFLASKWDETPHLFGDIIRAIQAGDSGSDLPVTLSYVEENAWPKMKDRFELPDEFTDYGALFRLLLSYVESTPATRALRFQALHSLHRNMWATGKLTVAIGLLTIIFSLIGLEITRSVWYGVGTFVSGTILIYVFEKRKEKFNQKFVQYAIADFYAFETQDD